MKVRTLMLMLVSALLMVVGTGGANAATSDNTTSPRKLLLSYYNDINLKDYQSAYALWTTPRQTYDQFAAGFASTAYVEAYFGEIQPFNASLTGQIPVVLISDQTDDTTASYYGCFTVQNLRGVWSIAGAKIYTLSTTSAPDSATTTRYLGIDCTRFTSGGSKSDTFRPVVTMDTLMHTYYDAINRRDYQAAYDLWLHPIPGPQPNGQPAKDYRPSYQSYTQGYSDTLFVDIYLGSYNEMGASAGHSYLNGVMPVMLIGQHTDGSFVTYSGCYVLGFHSDGTPGIVSGSLAKWSDDVPLGTDILALLSTLDCTRLNLSY